MACVIVASNPNVLTVRVGCEFRYETDWPMTAVLQVVPRPDGAHWMLRDTLSNSASIPFHAYLDLYGNLCQRVTLPAGRSVISYDALVQVADRVDAVVPTALQVPLESVSDDAILYTLPSRYCLSDELADTAWKLFAGIPMGWARVQAICDWVHDNVRFEYGTSTPMTTAADVYRTRVGVCRDFAHLAVSFCRAMSIPARYVFGYLPDIGVAPPDSPMDFCAWFEAYLDGQWYTFDPRNNIPRTGRVVIGYGRDALDVAMVTCYGSARLEDMRVWADKVDSRQTQPVLESEDDGADMPGGVQIPVIFLPTTLPFESRPMTNVVSADSP